MTPQKNALLTYQVLYVAQQDLSQAAFFAKHVEQTLHRVRIGATKRAVQGESHVTQMEPRSALGSRKSCWVVFSARFACSTVTPQPS